MNGVAVLFSENGATFLPQQVSGFAALVQCAMVNLGTRKGTDPLYADRGTNLFRDAVAGRLVDVSAAQHSSNFAANDTVFFLRDFADDTDPDGLAICRMEPTDFNGNQLLLDVVFTSNSGVVIGTSAVI